MLANRLRKRDKHLRKWAKRVATNAYRVYDRDIPEIPLVVERYGDAVAVYDYADEMSNRHPRDWCEAIADALAVDEADIFWKVRKRQKGTQQYERIARSERRRIVHEQSYRFWVNLRDYLDTGLFLDHRQTRHVATEDVEGKSVLNLFAYTGSFSVYAAARGARRVTTVDLSNTYLNWARDYFSLNDIETAKHEFVRADVIEWLKNAHRNRRTYDVIILDPPTFSNSKSMQRSFEVERDQVELLMQCRQLLAADGMLWLSTNKRRFKLMPEVMAGFDVYEQTQKTQPEDFRRRPHQCWCLVPKETST